MSRARWWEERELWVGGVGRCELDWAVLVKYGLIILKR